MRNVQWQRHSTRSRPGMENIQTRVSTFRIRSRRWIIAELIPPVFYSGTNTWCTIFRFTCTGRSRRNIHRKNPRPSSTGGESPGGCFLGRKKDYSNASPQLPRVAAREYSVARFSKKFVCSTPLSISSIHGSGLLSIWWIGLRPSWPSRRSAM